MSDLEKYILEHRDELDRMEAVPEEAIWQRIRAGSSPQKPPGKAGFNWKWLSIAALVLALAGWGLLFFKKQPEAATPVGLPEKELPVSPQNNAPELPAAPIAEPKTSTQDNPAPAIAQAKKARTPKQKKATKKAEPATPNLSDQELRLQQLVNQKKREIGFDRLDRAAYAELLKELDELEITVEQARKDFAGMPQNERLLETLTKYYELKIKILEQISNEINKREYHEALEKRI